MVTYGVENGTLDYAPDYYEDVEVDYFDVSRFGESL